jgi:hypothetical protein
MNKSFQSAILASALPPVIGRYARENAGTGRETACSKAFHGIRLREPESLST